MKSIYIFLAEGYEPLEALAPMDILHRAKLPVYFVNANPSGESSGHEAIPSTQEYGLPAHLSWDEFVGKEQDSLDNDEGCMIFPGGLPGAETLGNNTELMDMLRVHYANGGLVAAICAAPAKVLAHNLDIRGRHLTVYEGFESELIAAGAVVTGEGVTSDGNLITAKGPGLAVDFGLAILYHMTDRRIADTVKHAMML